MFIDLYLESRYVHHVEGVGPLVLGTVNAKYTVFFFYMSYLDLWVEHMHCYYADLYSCRPCIFIVMFK
jgi:hypothetical protein